MAFFKHHCQSWAKIGLFFIGIKWFKLFKIGFILGTQNAFFSGANILAPLAGFFGGMYTNIVLCFLGVITHWLSGSSMSLYALLSAYHIPTFFASAYWVYPQKVFRIGIPLLCMLFFMLHPSGSYFYALYWLIPIILYFIPHKTFFLHALSATFVQHAVGSVICLCTVPMNPHMWLVLMPIVLVERIIFALGMTLCAYAIKTGVTVACMVKAKYNQYSQRRCLVPSSSI